MVSPDHNGILFKVTPGALGYGEKPSYSQYEINVPSPSSSSSGEMPVGDNADCHSLFSDGIVYQGYRTALSVTFYPLQPSTEPLVTYHCLMANCPRNDFKTLHEMLHHLGCCESFREIHLLRCRSCNHEEPFWTMSKRCLLKRLKDFIKNIMGFSSSSKAPQSPEYYQASLHSLSCDTSQYPHNHLHNTTKSPTNGLPERQFQTAPPDYPNLWELHDTSLHELPGVEPYAELPDDHLRLQLPELSGIQYYELESPPCSASGLSNTTAELHSATVSPATASQSGMPSVNNSPTSVSDVSEAFSECHPNNYPPPAHCSQHTGDTSMVLGNFDYQTAQIFEELSAPNPLLLSLSSQSTVDPSYLERRTWEEQMSSRDASCLPTLGGVEDNPSPKRFFSPDSFSMSTSTLIGPEANPSSSVIEKDVPMQDVEPCDDHSPLHSNGSENPQPTRSSELTPNSRCSYPGCNFEPSGIPENYPAYLRKHKAIHEQKESIRCDYCVKTYTRRDNMKVHVRKAHSGEIGLNEF